MRFHFLFFLIFILCRLHSSGKETGWTFYKNIAPLVRQKCGNCHRPGGSAPFSLSTYNDFSTRSKQIKYVVQAGIMPIWKPDPSFSHFEGENYLTASERKMLTEWIDQGMLKGIGSAHKATGRFVLPKPDLVIQANNPLILQPTGEETFAILKIPFEFPDSFAVSGIEFVSEQADMVHHVSIFVLRQPDNNFDITTGNSQYIFPPVDRDTLVDKEFNLYNHLHITPPNIYDYWNLLAYKTHWQPGKSYKPLPDGTGFIMPRKGVILIDMIHYLANPKTLIDNIKINVYKSKKQPERFALGSSVGIGDPFSESSPIVLMPNQKTWLHSETTLPADMSLLEITPHMHNIGRRFIAYAVTPNYDTLPLVSINDWDMGWQETYRFNSLLKLPQGSRIVLDGYYDNSTDNPKNPFNPPRIIRQSMNKQDEMLLLIITFFEYRNGDETKQLRYNGKPWSN